MPRNSVYEVQYTNYIKYNIDKTGESLLCKMCDTRNETISREVSECGKLAQKEYKLRCDSVGIKVCTLAVL